VGCVGVCVCVSVGVCVCVCELILQKIERCFVPFCII